MNAKRVSLFFLLLIFSLTFTQITVAAESILDSPALQPIKKAFESEVRLPLKYTGLDQQSYTIGIVLLGWIFLFALLYLILNMLLKTTVEKAGIGTNAVAWMAFAVSGIAVLGSPYIQYASYLIGLNMMFFFIMLIVLSLIMVWSVLMAGTNGFAGMRLGSSTERAKLEAENQTERRKVDTIRRDISNERKLENREDAAIKNAESLLSGGIAGAANGQKQIELLINIIEQISQVRDQGQAANLRKQFHTQAAAVGAAIGRNIKLDVELRKLAGQLRSLEQGEIQQITRLRSDLEAAKVAAAGAPLAGRSHAIENWINAETQHILAFENAQRRLVGEIQLLLPATGGTLVSEIQHLMDAVIRDVEQSDYPDAVANLNQALDRFRQESSMLTRVRRLLTESEAAITAIQARLTANPPP